jgi:hypothetical protein
MASNERAKPEEYVFKNIITNGLSVTAFGTEVILRHQIF